MCRRIASDCRLVRSCWSPSIAFRREVFEGELTFISRQAEFTPSNVQTPEERAKQVFRIKVAIQEGSTKLRPGMTADVWLRRGEPAAMNDIVIDAQTADASIRRSDRRAKTSAFKFTAARSLDCWAPTAAASRRSFACCWGFLPPSDGTASVLGHDAYLESETIKPRVGYMSQQFSLYADLSVRENIEFYGRIYGLDAQQPSTADGSRCGLTSIHDYVDQLAGTLSGGWQRRLALACALIHRAGGAVFGRTHGGN